MRDRTRRRQSGPTDVEPPRPAPAASAPSDTAQDAPPVHEPKRAARSDSGVRRIVIPLADDGSIAADRLKPAQRDAIAGLLNHPSARQFGGRPADAGPSMASTMLPLMANTLVSAIATLDLFLVQKMTKAPGPMVAQLCAWTPDEKAAVAPAVLAVANKYGGPLLDKFEAEAALVAALVGITFSKVQIIREALDRMPQPAPQPMPAEPESAAS